MSENAAPWVEGLTVGQVLQRTAERYPTHDAALFPAQGLELSYRAFAAEVDAAARGLLLLGIGKGDHVAIWATSVPQWVLLQFATARIGAVLITVNPAYRPFELEYVLRQSDAVALFLVDRYKTSDYYAMLQEVCPALAESVPGEFNLVQFPRMRWVVALRGQTPRGAID
ncbi:MAG TPA: AMP-binding protein, partial [Pirellulales bacterium]|nr:AMP-binding protein [Pirellulales bacterium]